MVNKRALLIGINEYYSARGNCLYNSARDSSPKCPARLYECLDDIIIIKDVLVNKYSFTPANITELTDNTADLPTKENILLALKKLVDDTQRGDIVVIVYSGHGSQLIAESEPSNYIQSIVPIDSGRCLNHPEKDISNSEIRQFIDKLSLKTDKITLIFDCCYSGHIVRNLCGMTKGVEPVEVSSDRMVAKGLRELAANDSAYVLLAACLSNQLATDGVWTRAIVNAINMAPVGSNASLTHQQIYERAFVEAVTHQQRPIIQGHLSQQQRKIFDSDIVLVDPYALVTKRFDQNGQKVIQLDVGEVHGVSVGSQFGIYPPNQTDAHEQIALVTIKEVHATKCLASHPTGLNSLIKPGSWAIEKFHVYDKLSFVVRLKILDETFDWIREEKLEKFTDGVLSNFSDNLITKIKGCPVLEWNSGSTDEPVDCTVLLIPPTTKHVAENEISKLLQTHHFAFETPSIVYIGKGNTMLANPTEFMDPDKILDDVYTILESLGRYYRALRLTNDNLLSNPIHNKISLKIEFAPPEKRTWFELNRSTPQTVHGGYSMRVTITNNSLLDVYIYLIDFAEDGTIQQVIPQLGGEQKVAKGKTFSKGFDSTMTAESQLLPFETLKLFASTCITDFKQIAHMQQKLRGGSGSALEELLTAETTRKVNIRIHGSVDYWTSDQYEFRIEK